MYDWDSLIAVPPLNIKKYPPDGWNTWFTQFRLHTQVTAFPKLSDLEKVAVLLLKLGDDVTPIFHTFSVGIDEVSYHELVELFGAYFSPAKTRNVFLSTKQKSGESFDQFAERLTSLSYPCCFGPFHNGILRDVFLHNIHSMYADIRDKIFKYHRDPSFQEVLRIANELLLGTCNVSRSNHDETTIPTPAVSTAPRDVDTMASNAVNPTKRKEMETTSDSTSVESFKLNFKTPQPPSALQPNQSSEERSFILDNSRSATKCDSTSTSHKLSFAIKKALDNNSVTSKSSSSFSSKEIPKLDFAFKCFSVSEAANNNPLDGTPNPESLSRVSSYSSNKNLVKKSQVVNRCNDQQPLNLSCDKPAGVSARLFKYGNQSNLVDATKTPISSGKIDDKSNMNVPFKSQNVLSDINRSYQKDREVNSSGDSCTHEVGTRSLVSQIHTNRENSWPSPQNDNDNEVNPAQTKLLFTTHRTRSPGIVSSQSMDGSTNNTVYDVSQDYSGTTMPNSDTSQIDIKPEPPVSKNFFSEVVIVFISENDDTIYVCPVVKFQYLATIEAELRKLADQNSLQSIKNITVGEKYYAAPFQGDWYRAEMISADMKKKTVRIAFIDYGNEENVPLSDLRLLPEEFQELEPLSFPIRLPKGAPEIRSGSKLKIRPLSLEDDWSWAVELRTNQR